MEELVDEGWRGWVVRAKDEVRRLPTIAADMTSVEQESARSSCLITRVGTPSPPPLAPPPLLLPPSSDFSTVVSTQSFEASIQSVFGTGFDNKNVLDLLVLVILGKMR